MNTLKGYIRVEDSERVRRRTRESLIRATFFGLGICEQLRFIYDSIADLPDAELKEKLTEQLVDAMIMAKKMNKRLVYYKSTYLQDGTGNNGSNFVRLTNNGARRRMRQARVTG